MFCILSLHTGLHPDDRRYRLKLKNRIMKGFKEKVAILTSEKKMSGIVVDASALPTEIAFKDKEGCIIKATDYLKNDVLKHCEGLSALTWPPQLDELQDEQRNPPRSLMLFYKHLLQSKSTLNKTNPEYVQRLSNSFASNIIVAIRQGKTRTTKQFLLALGLHNITGKLLTDFVIVEPVTRLVKLKQQSL